jgi:DNA-binding transcriptional LysR family regulator
MDLDVTALRCFTAAVRTRSMTRAAAVLGRTQPAVSQQIRRLEDILGHRLVRRIATGVELTSEGESFLPLAERILSLNDDAQRHIRERVAGGRRRIGMIEDIAASGLQLALADFAHVHPELELDVLVAEGGAMRDAIAAGRLDLAVADVALISGVPRRRRTCALVWVSAPDFDPTRDPLPLVLFRHACEWRIRTLNALDRSGRRWRTAFESGSLTAIQAAVRAGVGVATLLAGNVEGDMVVLAPRDHGLPPAPRVELGLYRRPALLSDSVTDVLEGLLWRAVITSGGPRSLR